MLFYQATQDNKRLNRDLWSIKGELFTQKEVINHNINTASLLMVEVSKFNIYWSFGARFPKHEIL